MKIKMTLNLMSKKIELAWVDGKLVKVSDSGWKKNPRLKEDIEELEKEYVKKDE